MNTFYNWTSFQLHINKIFISKYTNILNNISININNIPIEILQLTAEFIGVPNTYQTVKYSSSINNYINKKLLWVFYYGTLNDEDLDNPTNKHNSLQYIQVINEKLIQIMVSYCGYNLELRFENHISINVPIDVLTHNYKFIHIFTHEFPNDVA